MIPAEDTLAEARPGWVTSWEIISITPSLCVVWFSRELSKKVLTLSTQAKFVVVPIPTLWIKFVLGVMFGSSASLSLVSSNP